MHGHRRLSVLHNRTETSGLPSNRYEPRRLFRGTTLPSRGVVPHYTLRRTGVPLPQGRARRTDKKCSLSDGHPESPPPDPKPNPPKGRTRDWLPARSSCYFAAREWKRAGTVARRCTLARTRRSHASLVTPGTGSRRAAVSDW